MQGLARHARACIYPCRMPTLCIYFLLQTLVAMSKVREPKSTTSRYAGLDEYRAFRSLCALSLHAEVVPTRMSHMQPSLWTAAGFNANDTIEFLNSLQASYNHPNIILSWRLPDAQGMLDIMAWVVQSAYNTSIDYVVTKGQADIEAYLNQTYVGVFDAAIRRMHTLLASLVVNLSAAWAFRMAMVLDLTHRSSHSSHRDCPWHAGWQQKRR